MNGERAIAKALPEPASESGGEGGARIPCDPPSGTSPSDSTPVSDPHFAESPRPRRRRRRGERFFIPAALLIGCAGMFVGADVIEQYLFPRMSVGWHHALLTMRAAIVTGVGCVLVYLVMQREQRRLSDTAEHLSSLLESYKSEVGAAGHFENPYLVYCRDVLTCNRPDCPHYTDHRMRCWQTVALCGASRGDSAPPITIQKCHECDVYRMSCPDGLTELGESFNNLMFLLQAEAKQVGRMRAQLVEEEKMVAIGQIASGIAHEVGNPLSSISSIVQMLQRGKGEMPANEQLELIQTHIRRISTTVRQLVSLARPSGGGWETIDIVRVLEEVVRLVGFDRRARGVEIVSHHPDSLPMTYGMRGQLEQVFINLCLNALDAMPDGGTLTINAEANGHDVRVHVSDTGCGIGSELGRRIFEPFFTTKQPGHGTGLGLSVSYGIVQKHGGSIDFTSVVGGGTEFTVQIPVHDQAPGA